MKKSLLFGAASLLAVSAAAATSAPTPYDDYQLTSISPNGKYVAGALFGSMQLINLETGDITSFDGDGMDLSYGVGNGRAVSDTGVVLGFLNEMGAVSYLENGEWIELKGLVPDMTNIANSITPDGNVICGSCGMAPISIDDTLTPMQVPVIWVRGADNKFGEPIALPYPEKDLSDRVPQYVTAFALSDDGTKVIGQMVDYSGIIITPVYYYKDGDSKWQYKLLAEKEINPNDVKLPEAPGDGPAAPSMEDYMTPEEKAAYDKALQDWNDEGTWDYSKYPNLEDYISEAGKAEYQKAYDAWMVIQEEWEKKMIAFDTALQQIVADGISFEFNQAFMSADGKTAWMDAIKPVPVEDPYNPYIDLHAPAMIDVEADKVSHFNFNDNCSLSWVAPDGTVFATLSDRLTGLVYNPVAAGTDYTTVKPEKWIDWLTKVNPESGKWASENLIQDVVGYDPDTFEEIIIPDVCCSGYTIASADLSVLVTRAQNQDPNSSIVITSYVIAGKDGDSGIAGAVADEVSVSVLADGSILLSGDVTSLTVCDMNGRVVYSSRPASNVVTTGLSAGAYIVRAVAADGSVKTIKAII